MKRAVMCIMLLFAAASFAADKQVVGYFTSWSTGTYPHTMVPWGSLTHIAHAFIGPKANGQLDVPAGFLNAPLIQAAHANGVKVVVSVGGWNTTYDADFSTMVADTAARRAFVANLKSFCLANGYDGADIDWEYPDKPADSTGFSRMIHELRAAFNTVTPNLTISMAGPASDWSGKWFRFGDLKNDFDWIGIMTYDFYGSWSGMAGPHSALYGTAPPNYQTWTDQAVNYYNVVRGVEKQKLLTGVPFYGWTFNAASLYGTASGNPNAVQEVYSTIAPRLSQGWTRTWDASSQVPYMQDAAHTKLTSYDDSASVALKANYTISKGVGGVIIWALGQDKIGSAQPLLSVLGSILRPTVAVNEGAPALPQSTELAQNYPNPFNPTTTVRYVIPASSMVSLVVYDPLGREVSVLVRSVQSAGTHSATFDAAGLPSGVYFYRLRTGASQLVGKMVLLK